METAVGELGKAMTCLVGVDEKSLSDGEVHRALLSLTEELSTLLAIQAKLADEWSRRGIWAEDGSRHPGARLARETRTRKASAYRVIRRGQALSAMPATAEALTVGRINIDHVELLATANTSKRRDRFLQDESMLVGFCEQLHFWDAEVAINYWKLRVDADLGDDGKPPRWLNRQARDSRGIDGEIHLDAIFDAVGGATFMAAWNRIDDELRLRDQAVIAETGELPRTRQQRRLDALVEMAVRATTSAGGGSGTGTDHADGSDAEQTESDETDNNDGDGPNATASKDGGRARPATPCRCQRARPRPLVTVVLGDATFRWLCELSDGTVIAPGELVPYLSDVDINTMLFGGPFHAIAGSTTRTFSGLLRRAIEVRDRRCQHPASDGDPINKCDVDHIIPKIRGGVTCQCNGQLMESGRNRDPRRRNLTADDITIHRDDPTFIAARDRIEALIASTNRRAPPN
jgi:Domain of unknown function (DUF222)